MTINDPQTLMIRPEPTPNPASVRFVIGAPLLERGTADIKDLETARSRSPLAENLFGLAPVRGVMLGPNFVTVTADPSADWRSLVPMVIEILREYFATGAPVLVGPPDAAPAGAHDNDEVAQGVIRIIDMEIRPAVAMDGGDVVFNSYRDGIVYVHLRGSCHGCPSATMTLKMGIERRLQEAFPEIIAVEAM